MLPPDPTGRPNLLPVLIFGTLLQALMVGVASLIAIGVLRAAAFA